MTISDCYAKRARRKADVNMQDKPANSIRLLFIDDDPTILEGYRFIFEDEGYHVDTAVNISEMIQFVTQYEYDVVILDYNLDNLNGVEMAKRIFQIKSDIKLIFISGQKNAEEKLINNNIKIAGFFEKPLKAETLLEYISSYLME